MTLGDVRRRERVTPEYVRWGVTPKYVRRWVTFGDVRRRDRVTPKDVRWGVTPRDVRRRVTPGDVRRWAHGHGCFCYFAVFRWHVFFLDCCFCFIHFDLFFCLAGTLHWYRGSRVKGRHGRHPVLTDGHISVRGVLAGLLVTRVGWSLVVEQCLPPPLHRGRILPRGQLVEEIHVLRVCLNVLVNLVPQECADCVPMRPCTAWLACVAHS